MAYEPVDPEPVDLPGTLKNGIDQVFGRTVLRGCVDDNGIIRWCYDPPDGGIKCRLHCPAGGRPLVLTRR
jgi:hypothetical protein